MPKIWKLKSQPPQNIDEKLSDYPKLLAQLLYNRGITEKEKIQEFIEPKYEGLNSPFLFLDMQKAVDRIWLAIDRGEKICIYGDYDADAVTANAVLQQTFKYLGVEVESYIPDRFTEGYGINMEALQKIKDKGSTMIITVDCGTNSIDAAEFCSANGIDLIITDHHEVIGELPKAFAVINPKNRQDKYPYEDITGVGVAFKLASAILSKHEKVTSRLPSRNFSRTSISSAVKNIRDPEQSKELDPGYSAMISSERNSGMEHKEYSGGYEKWLLDLVAIGTVADCHSLLGENRILVKYGLRVLAKTRWVGLRALIKSSALDFTKTPPDTYTLGFVIAPRLNAAGRLEHADVALNLLMETDPSLAAEKAEGLEQINRKRQDQTARIVSEAKEQALVLGERKIIVIAGEGWNKGVVGLVAGRLAEEFYKPVIVMEKTAEFSTGSARTVGEFNILEAIKFSSQHVLRFGGHKQAAGLTVETKNLELFYQQMLIYADANMPESANQKTLELEAELGESDLSLVTCHLLLQMEPFGASNPKPKFLITGMKIASWRQMGASKQHSQMQLQKGAKTVSAIAFNSAALEKSFKPGDTVDVAAELMEDTWNGRSEVKLRVVDLRSNISM
jgi:single-stranded-DNA-specific exonuclease